MPDDFKDYPKSITELRSSKSNRASDWKPRDVLIDMLRMIDSGEVSPSALIVCYRDSDEDGGATKPGFRVSSPDPLLTLGILTYTAQRIARLGDE